GARRRRPQRAGDSRRVCRHVRRTRTYGAEEVERSRVVHTWCRRLGRRRGCRDAPQALEDREAEACPRGAHWHRCDSRGACASRRGSKGRRSSVILALVIGTLLAVGALAFVLYPVFAPPPQRRFVPPTPRRDEGNDAVAALREIEFDRATGKLSDVD